LQKNKAIFFDRDGVVNKELIVNGIIDSPSSVEEVRLYEDAAEAIRYSNKRGYLVIIATNQPRIARGSMIKTVAQEINDRVISLLKKEGAAVDGVYMCPHDDADNCKCRKPRPGMILQASKEHDIDLSGSYFVGDREKDVVAGKTAGCRTVILQRRYNAGIRADFMIRSLKELKGIIA